VLGDLRTTVQNALATLFNAGAVARTGTTVPDLSRRDLWLAGHSAGNRSMWTCARNNAADVSRMITFDATPYKDNLGSGLKDIMAVAEARKKAGKALDLFAIVTPNLGQNKPKPGQDKGKPAGIPRPPVPGPRRRH
jgi:hypothetical protein